MATHLPYAKTCLFVHFSAAAINNILGDCWRWQAYVEMP